MRSRMSLAAAFAAAFFLAGCATPPQPPVPLQATAISAKTSRIGVAMTPLPKVDTYLPGAGCLLCLAAASLANSSLTTYTKTLPYEDLPKLKESVAQLIRQRGGEPVVIAEEVKLDTLPNSSAQGQNIARKDFSSLAKKYSVDKLLVIDIVQLGFERTYSAYVPTSDPKGVLRGSGSLVDLKTNTLEWYQPLAVLRSSDGAWDEPPKFPGLTNAYFQTIELGKDEVLKPFKP